MNEEIIFLLVLALLTSWVLHVFFFSKIARETRIIRKENKILEDMNIAIEKNDVSEIKRLQKLSKFTFTINLATYVLKIQEIRNKKTSQNKTNVAKQHNQ
jgi:hypothetical protein